MATQFPIEQTERLPYARLAPKLPQALSGLSVALGEASIGKTLADLIYLRVSQINGCAYCTDSHWKDLVHAGVDARKLNTLGVWHESPFFSPAERATLAWSDVLTQPRQPAQLQDECFEALRAHFNEQQIVEISFAIACMNAWNRIGIGMRKAIPAE